VKGLIIIKGPQLLREGESQRRRGKKVKNLIGHKVVPASNYKNGEIKIRDEGGREEAMNLSVPMEGEGKREQSTNYLQVPAPQVLQTAAQRVNN